MEAYYGGRSGVSIRHKFVEVIHNDYKSEYPTVNALMQIQKLLIAEYVECVENSDASREFLETVTLEDMQKKENWRLLTGIALVEPDNDILPFRTEYVNVDDDKEKSFNIGINKEVALRCPRKNAP